MALVTPVGSQVVEGLTAAISAAEHAESIVDTLQRGYGKVKAIKKTAVSSYRRYRDFGKSRPRAKTRNNYRTRRTGNFPSYKGGRAYNLTRTSRMSKKTSYKKRKKTKTGLTATAVKSIARKEVNKAVEIKRNPYYRSTNGISADLGAGLHAGEALIWLLGNNISRGTTHVSRDGSHINYLGANFRVFVENKCHDAKMGVRVMLVKPKYPGSAVTSKLFQDNDNNAEESPDNLEGGNVIATSTHLNNLYQLYKPINKDRYEVKYNKVFFCDRAERAVVDSNGNQTNSPRVANRFFQKYFKINDDIAYDNDSPTNIYKIILFYQYITTSPLPSATKPVIQVGQFDEFFNP